MERLNPQSSHVERGGTSKMYSLLGDLGLLKNCLFRDKVRLLPPSLPTFGFPSTIPSYSLPCAATGPKSDNFLKLLLLASCSLLTLVYIKLCTQTRLFSLNYCFLTGEQAVASCLHHRTVAKMRALLLGLTHFQVQRVPHTCRTAYTMVSYGTSQCLSTTLFLTFRFPFLEHT